MNDRNNLKNSNILIVGGAGFVGSNLVKYLLEEESNKITVIDNLISSETSNLPEDKRLNFIFGSITDDSVLYEIDDIYDYIFHLATFHGNQNSIYDPLADHENNTYTTLKLFNYLKKFKKIKKVVYSSAGCTVAEKTFNKSKATKENAHVSLFLDSPYQISKIIGEMYSNYFFNQHGLPVVKARFQNVYGPGEILGAGKWRGTEATVWRNVVPTFIFQALKKMSLNVENKGIATRDFIYISDIVRGLILCAVKGKEVEVYNLASGIETSILNLADMINKLTNNTESINLLPKRKWDNSGKRYGSTEKSYKEIDFKVNINIKNGLKKTIRWTCENFDFIESCIGKHKKFMENL